MTDEERDLLVRIFFKIVKILEQGRCNKEREDDVEEKDVAENKEGVEEKVGTKGTVKKIDIQ